MELILYGQFWAILGGWVGGRGRAGQSRADRQAEDRQTDGQTDRQEPSHNIGPTDQQHTKIYFTKNVCLTDDIHIQLA